MQGSRFALCSPTPNTAASKGFRVRGRPPRRFAGAQVALGFALMEAPKSAANSRFGGLPGNVLLAFEPGE